MQVTVVIGASQDMIPQLKKKYDVDTLDMVFLDHWKDRYLPDTILLEVSGTAACLGWAGCCCCCSCPLMGLSLSEESGALAEHSQGAPGGHRWLMWAFCGG